MRYTLRLRGGLCSTSFNMASSGKKKKKKVSKAKLKKIASLKGKKSAEKQGKGAGSRKSFSLPAKWSEEHTETDGKTRLKFVSPGKSEYSSEKAVAQTLAARNLEACFNASSALSEHSESEGSEFLPDMDLSDIENPGCSKSGKAESDDDSSTEPQPKKCKMDIERRFFVSETTQLLDFIEQVNRTSCCSTPDCRGKISIPNLLSL